MTNINETDYQNAINVIKQCMDYAKNIIKEHDGEYPDVKLLLLRETDNYYHRGHTKTYLEMDYHGLVTADYCADGTRWRHDINTNPNSSLKQYAYNSSQCTTIELAVTLAECWSTIKDKITEGYKRLDSTKESNSNLLANFKI